MRWFCGHPRHSLVQLDTEENLGHVLQHILEHVTETHSLQEQIMADFTAQNQAVADLTDAVNNTVIPALNTLKASSDDTADQAAVDANTSTLQTLKSNILAAVESVLPTPAPVEPTA